MLQSGSKLPRVGATRKKKNRFQLVPAIKAFVQAPYYHPESRDNLLFKQIIICYVKYILIFMFAPRIPECQEKAGFKNKQGYILFTIPLITLFIRHVHTEWSCDLSH
jgi:hypothetical protein